MELCTSCCEELSLMCVEFMLFLRVEMKKT
jgi:hypothetical protein